MRGQLATAAATATGLGIGIGACGGSSSGDSSTTAWAVGATAIVSTTDTVTKATAAEQNAASNQPRLVLPVLDGGPYKDVPSRPQNLPASPLCTVHFHHGKETSNGFKEPATTFTWRVWRRPGQSTYYADNLCAFLRNETGAY